MHTTIQNLIRSNLFVRLAKTSGSLLISVPLIFHEKRASKAFCHEESFEDNSDKKSKSKDKCLVPACSSTQRYFELAVKSIEKQASISEQYKGCPIVRLILIK